MIGRVSPSVLFKPIDVAPLIGYLVYCYLDNCFSGTIIQITSAKCGKGNTCSATYATRLPA
jgi:hypothetical protein